MKERTFTPPFFIQMSSGEHNLHCDKFPHGSIHEVKKCLEEDNLWVTKSKLDFIPKNFKTIVVENKPETKICEGCKNEFSKDWIFVKYKTPESENKEMCVRCYERIYISHTLGAGKDNYRDALREEIKKEFVI